MTTFHWICVYCVLIVTSSLAGGWLPSLVRLTHTRMQLIISFIGGLMLGVSLFHLLPHGAHLTNSLDRAIWWMVMGLLTMFFLIRVFNFHQHDTAETGENHGPNHDRVHGDDAGSDHRREGSVAGQHGHRISWIGVATGLGIHTLIDGVALGAGVVSEARFGVQMPGLSIFLVILLHKPLDALSITSLMATTGWSVRTRQMINVAFAMMCPLGATLFALGLGDQQGDLIGCALAFSAGVFLCISLGDLLPELHFHAHDRVKLSAALLLGMSVAYVIGALEPHAHETPSRHSPHDPHHDYEHILPQPDPTQR